MQSRDKSYITKSMTNFKHVYFTMCILDNYQQESEFANPILIGRIYYQNLATYPLWNFDSSLDYTLPLNMFMMPMNLTPWLRDAHCRASGGFFTLLHHANPKVL